MPELNSHGILGTMAASIEAPNGDTNMWAGGFVRPFPFVLVVLYYALGPFDLNLLGASMDDPSTLFSSVLVAWLSVVQHPSALSFWYHVEDC
ncbi:hypothetical protein Tco_1569547 [Tanacetum coccineum]